MADDKPAAVAAELASSPTPELDVTDVPPPPPPPAEVAASGPPPAAEPPAAEEPTAADLDAAIPQSASFKEESNVVADLPDPEKKALDELKVLVAAALSSNAFAPPPPPAAAVTEPPAKTEEPAAVEPAAVEPAKAETAAAESSAAPAAAVEEPAAVLPVAEEPAAAPAAVVEEPAAAPATAVEEPVIAPVEEAALPAPEVAAPAAAETEAAASEVEEEKAVVVEDEVKTVEAIEETIVPVTTTPPVVADDEQPAVPAEDILIWGVPLVGDDKSDTVLLKFLRARDFKPKDALAMIKHAVIWRKQFGIETLLEEELGVAPELTEKVVFMHGADREGHPVCYNVYGEFQDKDLYAKAFGDEEKREKFLKWRIQFLEKGIRQILDFSPGGISTMVQITDLKNVVGPGKRELRAATKQALTVLQDSYPEFAAKQIFINVPWWYLAYNRTIGSIFTPRSKSKFVFAGPSSSTETLFKYIAPEQVPVQYGGLSKEDADFTAADAATDVTIKPSSKHTIEIPATEASILVWEFRVLGWEVSYGAEFVPSAEGGYTVIVTKAKKFAVTDEPVVKNTFKVSEPGKVVITIENTTSKKKKLLYRSKVKSATEST